MFGMTREKIAVSLPAELVRAARQAVKAGRAASVSGYVEAALAAHVASDDDAWIDEMLEATGGPMTKAERARTMKALGW
jgi:Arc/MetJ-type ribon-helix-helix transcriptional regulator